MSKNKQLYNLRVGISTKASRIRFLLENIIYKAESLLEKNSLAGLALDEANRIAKMSEKIGKILKH